jgi:hypothetical protein
MNEENYEFKLVTNEECLLEDHEVMQIVETALKENLGVVNVEFTI